MPTPTKASKASYSPVLRRDRKEDSESGPGARTRSNPFEQNGCWGKSAVFWGLSATLVTVIVAVILTISFVLTTYHLDTITEDRLLGLTVLYRTYHTEFDPSLLLSQSEHLIPDVVCQMAQQVFIILPPYTGFEPTPVSRVALDFEGCSTD